ncbi:hypothetical protein LRQ09_15505 [Acinetobacter soli]|uniref:hypothetical protein n=1 Tax=Acinetobacter soli TaxID=487316 RepID=UPI001F415CC3|nr:hypothetical protein [Acinetobacter soli]MCF3128762.1 hypothetical protein [Acinetobacter soli]
MSRNVSERDIKLLYGLSAARCNLCGITVFLPKVDEHGYTHIGQMAHNIAYANNENAPRFIDELSGDNSYDNLILLCANDHLQVDQNTKFYTVQKLNEIKKDFEESITRKLSVQLKPDQYLVDLINKNFELQFVCHNLGDPLYSIPFDIADIADINTYLLEANYPTLYPFRDHILNKYMDDLMEAYFELHPLLMKYYFTDNARDLRPIKEKPISPIDQDLILAITNTLRRSIYNWLEHCRQYYSN